MTKKKATPKKTTPKKTTPIVDWLVMEGNEIKVMSRREFDEERARLEKLIFVGYGVRPRRNCRETSFR